MSDQAAPPPKPLKVGLVCGSQRSPRAGPQITAWVHRVLEKHIQQAAAAAARPVAFDQIDVAALNLPLLDEPGIPAKIEDPSQYAHAHTRAWSARVSALDAFVFVTPQYNWGVPAGLKNALDYLFREWGGKPAMVVSYGGHGGGKAAEQLASVLGGGLRMRVPERTVNLVFPDRGFMVRAATGQGLGLEDGSSAVWVKEEEEVVAVWEMMLKLLGE